MKAEYKFMTHWPYVYMIQGGWVIPMVRTEIHIQEVVSQGGVRVEFTTKS